MINIEVDGGGNLVIKCKDETEQEKKFVDWVMRAWVDNNVGVRKSAFVFGDSDDTD